MRRAFFLLLAFWCCACKDEPSRLPFLGHPAVSGNDTLYPKISPFSFVDQNGATITNETFKGKIYVADFIFLSCPTICPRMNSQMDKVYRKYQANPKVSFLSHTIDPEHDTVERLKAYTDLQQIGDSWHFVTGNRDSIFKIATKSYFMTAYPDAKEPGGYVHGGGFLLVDTQRHIRGVYDGTNPEETKRLLADIEKLLSEP